MVDPARAVAVERQLEVRSLLGRIVTGTAANQLAAASREIFFPAGKVVYRQGDRAAHIHFVVSGNIELSTDGQESWSFGPRSVIGVLDAELDREYSRTARASADSRVIVVTVEDWFDIIEDNFELTQRTLRQGHNNMLEIGLSLAPDGGFGEPSSRLPARPSILAPPLSAGADGEDASQMNPFERLITVRLCPLFERAGTQSLIRVARACQLQAVAGREKLVEQGDPMTSLFIVASGALQLSRDDPELLATFGPTDVAGGYMIWLESWPVTLRALVDSTVLAISYDDLYDIMEDHFDLTRAVRSNISFEIERLQRLKTPI